MSDRKIITADQAKELLYGGYPMEDDSDPMIRSYSEHQGWVVQMGDDSYTNNLPDAPYEDAKLLAHASRALHTVIHQAKQIERLQAAVRFLESVWGSDVITQLREKGILAEGDMR